VNSSDTDIVLPPPAVANIGDDFPSVTDFSGVLSPLLFNKLVA
jgi:hypothetical protein